MEFELPAVAPLPMPSSPLDRLGRPFAVGGIALATLGLGFWLGRGGSAPVPVVETPVAPVAAVVAKAVEQDGPRQVESGLPRIDRLFSLGGSQACATGGRRLACTMDGGSSWVDLGEMPDRILAVLPRDDGTLLAAAADGFVYAVTPSSLRVLATPPGDLHVVDAASRDGRLFLLAHRYDQPADDLTLPLVIETAIYSVEGDGSLVKRGGLKGFGGEKLLLEDGAILTWALSDLRAWRSKDGGATFKRVPVTERFGADFGGLRAVVERRADRLPGPGRPARPASSLWVSREGGDWVQAFDTPGEVVVDFADGGLGAVVVRDEASAWVTRDGGGTFEVLWRDDRLDGVVALAHVAGRFLAAREDGAVLVLPVQSGAFEPTR